MGKIRRYDIERLSRHLSINLVEALQVNFDCYGRNRHTFNRMYLIISEHGGENFIHNHSSNEHFCLRSGYIYFIPANIDLEFNFCSDMEFISFHFYLELFNNYNLFSLHKNLGKKADNTYCIKAISRQIHEGCELEALCYLQGAVMCLVSSFIRIGAEQLERLDFITRKYGRLFEFIREKNDAKTTINTLAEVAGMSRDSLSREFSRDCGITLKHYLTRELVRHAENLLLLPDLTARNIAEKLNFSNEYYFSRFFKKNTGRTIKEYRHKVRRNNHQTNQ
jgi:AraC-like DNA-binding protein